MRLSETRRGNIRPRAVHTGSVMLEPAEGLRLGTARRKEVK